MCVLSNNSKVLELFETWFVSDGVNFAEDACKREDIGASSLRLGVLEPVYRCPEGSVSKEVEISSPEKSLRSQSQP